jgi:hypothetical protein
MHEQVDVIVLTVALVGLEVFADPGEDARQVADSERRECVTAVFGYEDQVSMKRIDNVSTLTNIGVTRHIDNP